jgi:hypothetical protein
MYKVNLLPRKVLITPDEVISQGPTDANPDPRVILQAIQIAEDRFVKPAIGKDLYNDFRDKKNVVVTTINKTNLESAFNNGAVLSNGEMVNAIELVDNAWYIQLWNEYLWKLTAECVIYIASPVNYSKFTASGEVNNNPQVMAIQTEGSGSSSVSLRSMQWKLDQILMNRIDPLKAAMHEWLCDNRGYFPLYNRSCKQNEDGISYQRKSGWIHMYDNDSGSKNCCD